MRGHRPFGHAPEIERQIVALVGAQRQAIPPFGKTAESTRGA